ncbi:DUF4870 family protein [Hydrogenovibrio halophilus]|uniref:DUF4870 family protein n=1 Tax=Hydrogenovibrio halophilus TaxID=373391 RepID=UPI0003712ECD|nr:hypothetical protein [Hydrogenovibrio halophilus]
MNETETKMQTQAETGTETQTRLTPPDTTLAKVVYILYFAGLFTGITAFIGLVMAYVKKGEADNPAWLTSHYRFQIHTFWFGLAYLIIGTVLMPVIMLGWLVFLWWLVWLIIRCVKGLTALDKGQQIEGGFFSLAEVR